MSAWFITSTGTGIGKTLVTAALAHQMKEAGRRVQALKPIVTGFSDEDFADSDPAILLSALGRAVTSNEIIKIAPLRFEAPLAPSMAAVAEGRDLDFNALVEFCQQEISQHSTVLIEGVGGVMVPLTRTLTVIDWIASLGVPAILVVGSYLGSWSHTLTALETLSARGIELGGIVISESSGGIDLLATADALHDFTPAKILCVPRITGEAPWRRAPSLLDLCPIRGGEVPPAG